MMPSVDCPDSGRLSDLLDGRDKRAADLSDRLHGRLESLLESVQRLLQRLAQIGVVSGHSWS